MDELFRPSLLHSTPKLKDNILGGISKIPRTIILPSGDWRSFVSEHERQNQFGLETYNCTGFAATNVIEALFFRNFGVKENFSDRALGVEAGTSGLDGNYLSKVAETIRERGLAHEVAWGWDSSINTKVEYYKPLTSTVLLEEKDFRDTYEVDWEWCYDDADPAGLNMKDALKLSPIAIASPYAYEANKDVSGVYHTPLNAPINHSTCLLFIDEDGFKYVQDSYETPVKKLDPSFPISYGIRYWIDKKSNVPPPMPNAYQFQEGFRYFLADAGGATLFFLGGKLRKDDLAKCLDQWIGRNNGELKDKSATITTAEIAGVQLFNLKSEPTNL